ncbi:hypothetical protein RIF29_24278 [Crotalaria pallida]|uniref:Sec-independent protein translocase protein TATA, chloroplastic n=1 Tax=Crotalaria pallida TaxID=3830 RepID=A0AAN9EK88_CROPI
MEINAALSLSCCSILIPRTRITAFNHLGFSSSSSLCCTPPTLLLSKDYRRRRRNKRGGLTCNALFGLGVPELVVIAGVAALVFGPKKLPEVGRSIGQTVKSFQQAAKEFESELKKEPDSTGGDLSEKSSAVSEQEKKDTEVSSSKESV